MFKSIFHLLIAVSLLINFEYVYASYKQEFLTQLKDPAQTPQDIYSTLSDQRGKAFPTENLLRGKLDVNELTIWNDLTSVALDFVNKMVRQYSSDSTQLQASQKSLINLINQLANKRLTQAGITAALNQINQQLAILNTIRAHALGIINKSLEKPYPADWVKEHQNAPVFQLDDKPYSITYPDFLAKFNDKNILSSLQNQTLDNGAFMYIMKLHGISTVPTLNSTLDTLEATLYRLKTLSSNDPSFQATQKQDILISQLLIDHLHTLLPGYVTNLEKAKMDVTLDKPSGIIFALASLYADILTQMAQEIAPPTK